jgi:hypothetical protein
MLAASQAGPSAPRDRKGRTRLPGFSLVPDPQQAQHGLDAAPPELDMLKDMFGSALDEDYILSVYLESDCDVQRTIDYLLSTTSAAAGGTTDPSGAAAGATARVAENAAAAGRDLWAPLPLDCKLLILEKLTCRQLARAAAVSHAFAHFAALRCARMTAVTVRSGAALASLRSLLAAHVNATHVRPVLCRLPLSICQRPCLAHVRMLVVGCCPCSCNAGRYAFSSSKPDLGICHAPPAALPICCTLFVFETVHLPS